MDNQNDNNPEYSKEELVYQLLVHGMVQRIEKYGQSEVLVKINKLKMQESTVSGYKKLFFEAVRQLEGLPKDTEE